jgi:steroid delta-isomerase-like uncharacterized protein
MDGTFVEEFGGRWQDAVNRQAVGEILELCAEAIRMDDPGLSETATGKRAVGDFFERTWKAFPDLRFTRPDPAYAIAPEASMAVARWSARGTMSGAIEPPGYVPTNSPVEFRGVDVWEFSDGLLCYWDGIYDVAGIGRQIGALPDPGSRAERFGARLQRLTARRMRRAPR